MKTIGTYVLAACISAVIVFFPLRILTAHVYYERALSALKSGFAGSGEIPESAAVLSNYEDVIRLLNKALWLDTSNATYHKAVADVYLRMGGYLLILQSMHEPLPSGVPSQDEDFRMAEASLQRAIRLEPTNPDYHFALGVLYDRAANLNGSSETELERAVRAYPVNAALRYAIALQDLNSGRTGEALEQTAALVKMEMNGRFTEVTRIWLFKSFEVAWKITKDPRVLRGMTPDDPDASLVLDEFLRRKGVSGR